MGIDVAEKHGAEPLAPGDSLGRYVLLAQVARGGMGQVWVARLKGARGFQKLVAIKTLLPELLDDPRIEQMLLEEARIASLIQHSNVVQTTELGEHRGYLYLVMEWIDGESLAFVLKRAEERGAIPLPLGVNLVAQACRGLHAAHELTSDLGVHLGVVHRDVSPHNVLVTHSGVVKLVDFGIAKAMNQSESFTENGEIKGKYSFMAPEQVLGEEVDRRADVFSLGITLFIVTTGYHPFKVGDRSNIIRAITSADPAPSPSSFVPGYPPALEAVVAKALAKDPADRYQSADALRVSLEVACPEAFSPRVEGELKRYLALVMADRAAARREALRRFQLAADERSLADAAAPGAIPSQSGGSLRAILIDNGSLEVRASSTERRRASEAPTAPGLRRRSQRTWALAAAGLAFATAALAVRATRSHAGRTSAAQPAGVELPGAAAARTQATSAPTPPPTIVVTAPVAPSASAVAVAPPGGSVAPAPSAVAPVSSGVEPTATSARRAAAVPGAAEAARPSGASSHPRHKAHPSGTTLDLMAPDYAK